MSEAKKTTKKTTKKKVVNKPVGKTRIDDNLMKGKILVEYNILTDKYKEVDSKTDDKNCIYIWMSEVPMNKKASKKD